MLRKIKLYGHLREHTGLKEVEAYVDSVRDAVSFLTCNWPKLESQIVQNNYHVLLDEDDVGEEELLYGGMFGTYGLGKTPAVIAGKGAFLTKVGTFTSAIGASLVLSGVSDLLTPTPQIPEAEQTPESSAFTSPLNVSMPGIAIPLVYGTAICGSIVVSTSIEVGNV